MQIFNYYYSNYWIENGDPRLRESMLVNGGPWSMFAIVSAYLMAVTCFGPWFMRERKPMSNLIWPIRFYNAFMVLFNAYLFVQMGPLIDWGLRSWGCGKSMQRFNQQDLIILELTLLSRYFDFFDSIFFVCRKKFDHLSILHVTHHALVPVIVWFAIKTVATPFLVFAAFINFPIHVIMYSYYCLSTFPSLRPYLWWKKYLTSIQIIQFCIDLVHSLQVVYFPSCNYHWLAYVETIFSVSFLYLFGQFYLRSYTSRRQKLGAEEANGIAKEAGKTREGDAKFSLAMKECHPNRADVVSSNGLSGLTNVCDSLVDRRLKYNKSKKLNSTMV